VVPYSRVYGAHANALPVFLLALVGVICAFIDRCNDGEARHVLHISIEVVPGI